MENRIKERDRIKEIIKDNFRTESKPTALSRSVATLEKNRFRLTREEYIDLNQFITHLKINTK